MAKTINIAIIIAIILIVFLYLSIDIGQIPQTPDITNLRKIIFGCFYPIKLLLFISIQLYLLYMLIFLYERCKKLRPPLGHIAIGVGGLFTLYSSSVDYRLFWNVQRWPDSMFFHWYIMLVAAIMIIMATGFDMDDRSGLPKNFP